MIEGTMLGLAFGGLVLAITALAARRSTWMLARDHASRLRAERARERRLRNGGTESGGPA